MSEPSYMDELRDAYYDLYDFAELFVSTDKVPGRLDSDQAKKQFYKVSEWLEDDGYDEEEIKYLSYIAIADAIIDKYHEKLLEEYYGYDEES